MPQSKKQTKTPEINKLVQEYWEQPNTLSIIDKNLHKIEIDIASKYLQASDTLADIGCGDGEATAIYAQHVKKCVGFERSNTLRAKATKAAAKSKLKNIEIKAGDIMEMSDTKEKFDVIVTQRMVINLLTWEEQKVALQNIYNTLKPGGRYIMIENTNDSFQAMNEMRSDVGMGPVPQHWHNRFFDYDALMEFMEGKFQLLKTHDLGLYYFLTRIYVSMFASFKGFGANAVKDPIFEHSDKAARILFEKYHDQIKIGDHRVFGPIQVLVFRRER
jgi:cyclopropane fatty-acyl-phospholipid synthase-like methyltransferase